jgi:hypothetical protein
LPRAQVGRTQHELVVWRTSWFSWVAAHHLVPANADSVSSVIQSRSDEESSRTRYPESGRDHSRIVTL